MSGGTSASTNAVSLAKHNHQSPIRKKFLGNNPPISGATFMLRLLFSRALARPQCVACSQLGLAALRARNLVGEQSVFVKAELSVQNEDRNAPGVVGAHVDACQRRGPPKVPVFLLASLKISGKGCPQRNAIPCEGMPSKFGLQLSPRPSDRFACQDHDSVNC